jgi:hypothetical protein
MSAGGGAGPFRPAQRPTRVMFDTAGGEGGAIAPGGMSGRRWAAG